jgi:hypothetical protein
MTKAELIDKLSALPPEAEVYHVNYDGCSECNPECMPQYHSIDRVTIQAQGWYPADDLKNVVVLE